MRILEGIQQGSEQWHSERANRFGASEAPAMMGVHKYKSRSDLLHEKATGSEEEVSASKQAIFNQGHAAEAGARPIAEQILDEELYPVTAVSDDGRLLASLDGLTMLGDVVWEHKLYNEALAEQVNKGELEDHYKWQLDQQLYISGADKALFMCSDGSEERCAYCWYYPDAQRFEQLEAGWVQFEKDLANYQPTEAAPEPEGRAPDALPALHVELKGEVSASNLDEFREHALSVIRGINRDLQTDEDFANADKTVKWCKDVEERLKAAKDHALSQTQSIDELFRTIDSISEEARQTRLELDKLVKSRKDAIRNEIKDNARHKLQQHVNDLNRQWEATYLPMPEADFAAAMKGKKTVNSLQNAVDDVLAKAKIEADQTAELIGSNLATLNDLAPEHGFLFKDLQQIITKPTEDFEAVAKARLAEYKEAEEKRQAERERQEKAKREQQEKAEQQKQERQQQAVAEFCEDPKPEPRSEAESAMERSERPSYDEIIKAVASAFGVSLETATNWIHEVATAEAV